MNEFQTCAQRSKQPSIMLDREKITTNDIIAQYPNGITIIKFDILHTKDGSDYGVIVFKEDETKFYNCGTSLFNILLTWSEKFAGDIAAANFALEALGGAKFKLAWTTNKKGRPTVQVEAVEA